MGKYNETLTENIGKKKKMYIKKKRKKGENHFNKEGKSFSFLKCNQNKDRMRESIR